MTAAQCDVEACNIVVVFVVQRDVAGVVQNVERTRAMYGNALGEMDVSIQKHRVCVCICLFLCLRACSDHHVCLRV